MRKLQAERNLRYREGQSPEKAKECVMLQAAEANEKPGQDEPGFYSVFLFYRMIAKVITAA